MRVAREQRRSGHDLARLAVAALNDFLVKPRLLDLGARRRRAERHAATELRAGHAEHVAQHPQERGVAVDIDRPIDAVELDRGGHSYLRAIRVDLTIRPLEPARTSSLENRALPAPQQASRRSYAAFVASAGVHSVPQPRPARYILSLVCCVNSTARRSLRSPNVSTHASISAWASSARCSG